MFEPNVVVNLTSSIYIYFLRSLDSHLLFFCKNFFKRKFGCVGAVMFDIRPFTKCFRSDVI